MGNVTSLEPVTKNEHARPPLPMVSADRQGSIFTVDKIIFAFVSHGMTSILLKKQKTTRHQPRQWRRGNLRTRKGNIVLYFLKGTQ